MAYNLTYIFGKDLAAGYRMPFGDIKLTIIFTVNLTGDDGVYLASSEGLHVKKWGSTSLEVDIIDFYLAPAQYEFEIFDGSGVIKNLFFDSVDSINVEKNFFVKLEIKYTGEESYKTEFSGWVNPTDTEYDESKKTFIFTAVPATANINEKAIFKEDENGEYQSNNPLALTGTEFGDAFPKPYFYFKYDKVNLTTVIEEIFKQVNSSIVTDIVHNWIFYGYLSGSYIEDFDLTDIILDESYLGTVFGGKNRIFPEIQTLGDLLKQLAFEYGAVAGILSEERAFFKQILHYDAADSQTFMSVKAHRRRNIWNDIDYVKIKNAMYSVTSGTEAYDLLTIKISGSDRQVKGIGWAPLERVDNNYLFNPKSENGLDKTIVSFADVYDYEISTPLRENNILALDGASYYDVLGIRQEGITASGANVLTSSTGKVFDTFGSFLAFYYYLLKNRKSPLEIDEFHVKGVHYSFLKSIDYNSAYFSITSLTKDFDRNESKIKAVEVKQYDYESGDSVPTQGTPAASVNYSVNTAVGLDASISYLDIGTDHIWIASIQENEILESISIIILEALNTGSVDIFRIYDQDGNLFTNDDVLLEEINISQKLIMKRYNDAAKLYLEFTQGTETPTAGYAYIIVKKLIRA